MRKTTCTPASFKTGDEVVAFVELVNGEEDGHKHIDIPCSRVFRKPRSISSQVAAALAVEYAAATAILDEYIGFRFKTMPQM